MAVSQADGLLVADLPVESRVLATNKAAGTVTKMKMVFLRAVIGAKGDTLDLSSDGYVKNLKNIEGVIYYSAGSAPHNSTGCEQPQPIIGLEDGGTAIIWDTSNDLTFVGVTGTARIAFFVEVT